MKTPPTISINKMSNSGIEQNYIVGTCKEMCPPKEANMREKQRLLHILEVIPGTESNPLPKADRNRVVKSFTRSAAGKSFLDPESLRPPDALLETIRYLLDNVVSENNGVSWLVKYDFIMDRLRAVRQDMVIQNVSRAHQIVILQPIIRFHAYSAYRCCEEDISNFDPHINNTHLQECLKRLLNMYDYFDHLEKCTETEGYASEFLIGARPFFEAMYLIFNLGDTNATNRSLGLHIKWRDSTVVTALEMSLNYINRNLFKVCRLLKQLPITLQMLAVLHLPEIRRLCLKTMSVAYNCKNVSFPVDILVKLLLYNFEDELVRDCEHYGLQVNENGIYFLKTDFNDGKAKVTPKCNKEIDERLKELDITTLLLYGE